VARLQSEHTALSGRIADLQRERDDAVRFQSECETRLLARAEAAEAEVTRLREENRVLRRTVLDARDSAISTESNCSVALAASPVSDTDRQGEG
jgi:hypothetical protein